MAYDLDRGAHSVYSLYYHFIQVVKYRKKVAKIHRKIERQRDDFSHKISRDLVSSHDLIAFEDLNITGMVKNHHLAKSIADAGWNKIVQYTMYKAESAGTSVELVDPRHTSQKCSGCGNIKRDLDLSDRIYHCKACGLAIDRDLNAAINIRNAGLIKVGRGTPEYTPVEIGALPGRATPVVETGTELRRGIESADLNEFGISPFHLIFKHSLEL